MASPVSDTVKNAKKRTSNSRLRIRNSSAFVENVDWSLTSTLYEDGRDSGLSSENSTPTVGSPITRHRRTASTPIDIINPSSVPRVNSCSIARLDCEKASKIWQNRSVNDSPRSVGSGRSRQFSSPLRTSRNVQSPSLDSGDEGSLRVDRDTYQYMFQDIVSIKTMLLKLKQVLQEPEENGLTRADTLNPFDTSTKNGLFYNLDEVGTTDVSTSPGIGGITIVDELADLRRQVIFLQGQIEDKDRTIQDMQFQMSKLLGPNLAVDNETKNSPCNAATQTEKVRPVSAGPSLLQSLPQDGVMGPLVSWSDSWDRQRPSLLAELNTSRSPRKLSDRLPRTIQPRQEQNAHLRQNGLCSGKISSREGPASRHSHKTKNEFRTKSKEDDYESRIDSSPIKSFIPTSRKLATSTLIPRTSSRTVSATGRAHHT